MLVLVHDSDDGARDNALLLERRIRETASTITNQPWRDYIPELRTRVAGRTLVAASSVKRPPWKKTPTVSFGNDLSSRT